MENFELDYSEPNVVNILSVGKFDYDGLIKNNIKYFDEYYHVDDSELNYNKTSKRELLIVLADLTTTDNINLFKRVCSKLANLDVPLVIGITVVDSDTNLAELSGLLDSIILVHKTNVVEELSLTCLALVNSLKTYGFINADFLDFMNLFKNKGIRQVITSTSTVSDAVSVNDFNLKTKLDSLKEQGKFNKMLLCLTSSEEFSRLTSLVLSTSSFIQKELGEVNDVISLDHYDNDLANEIKLVLIIGK